MKILSLDISAKTGWALGEIKEGNLVLLGYGQCLQRKQSDFSNPSPYDILVWANQCFKDILVLIEKFDPDELSVEQTCAGSKNWVSQKVLEWIHYNLVNYLSERKRTKNLPIRYFLTGEWRKAVGCQMTKEQKKQNQEVKKQNAKGIKVAKGADGKRIGKVGKKHVNVMKANEYFNLSLKQKENDIADALLLLKAFHLESCGNIEK